MFILAALNCRVKALEKSPYVGVLVHDALTRARENAKTNSICERIDFSVGDSLEFLKYSKNGDYDVIYIDPMFPPKKKSALPKKEMIILQRLLHRDDSKQDIELLTVALEKAGRVVVKRPIGGAPLLRNPDLVFKGTSTRFDVYLTPT
jgi:16S rRNA (guanine1516-N2)-methyltransferase